MQSSTMYFSKVQSSVMYVRLVQGNSIQFRANYNAVKHCFVEETLSLLMCSCSVRQVKLVCGIYVIGWERSLGCAMRKLLIVRTMCLDSVKVTHCNKP